MSHFSRKTILLNKFRIIGKLPPIEFLLSLLGPFFEYGSIPTRVYPNHYQYSKNSIRLRSRGGINFILDISDIIDWATYFGFKHQPELNLFHEIKAGFNVLDVGANHGAMAMRMAQRVGPTGMVHCFELDSSNYLRLQRNFSINQFNNIKSHNIALGHKSGMVTVDSPDVTNSGANRVSEYSETQSRLTHMNTIDAFLSENRITRVDLIKIDTEGFEKNILTGAANTLLNMRPLLFVEVVDNHLKHFGSSGSELILAIENFRYKVVHSVTGEKITSTTDLTGCAMDIFAIPL
jgi:FkbM family methyltransferase